MNILDKPSAEVTLRSSLRDIRSVTLDSCNSGFARWRARSHNIGLAERSRAASHAYQDALKAARDVCPEMLAEHLRQNQNGCGAVRVSRELVNIRLSGD